MRFHLPLWALLTAMVFRYFFEHIYFRVYLYFCVLVGQLLPYKSLPNKRIDLYTGCIYPD